MKISICAAVPCGESALNLVLGLRWSRRPPGELILAHSGEHRIDLPPTSFPIRQLLTGRDRSRAAGRNEAARAANGELLIFLAPDCIADPHLVEDYAVAAARRIGAMMGCLGELPDCADDSGRRAEGDICLAGLSEGRAGPGRGRKDRRVEIDRFLTDNFAICSTAFARCGGFDEGAPSDGACDAAFGQALESRHLPLWQLGGAVAYRRKRQQAAGPRQLPVRLVGPVAEDGLARHLGPLTPVRRREEPTPRAPLPSIGLR